MVTISGSDLSGSDGDANRTYTLTDTTFQSSTLAIYVNGLRQYSTADYSLSGSVITFVNNIFDDQVILIEYDTVASSTANGNYGSTLELARFMNILGEVPDPSLVGEDRSIETVGTGDGSTLVFYLDHAYVIDGTYTISYGASADSVTDLTETTHYVIDKDIGKITLTTAGATAVSTDNIYASYGYCTIGVTDTQLAEALDRAEANVDDMTNNHFADGTDATPDWNQELDEEHDGKLATDRNYFTSYNYPLPDVSTTLNGAVSADDATITVDSTNGFPSSGYLLIESDKIAYTGKTSTTFTGCTSVSSHDNGKTVSPYVIEVSTTEPGGTVSWSVLENGTEFEIDKDTGRVHLYADGSSFTGQYVDIDGNPPAFVANRLRFSYIYGWSTIPDNIQQLTLMLAAQDIMSMIVRQKHSDGMNDYNPSLLNVDQARIDKIVGQYKNERFSRV